jgi:hypothetical protein
MSHIDSRGGIVRSRPRSPLSINERGAESHGGRIALVIFLIIAGVVATVVYQAQSGGSSASIYTSPPAPVSNPAAPATSPSLPASSPAVETNGETQDAEMAGRRAASEHIAQAHRLYEERQYKDAVSACDAALVSDPENEEAKQLRARLVRTMEILGVQ